MYGALWRALPGPRWVKALVFVAFAAVALLVLFTVVFPYVSERLFDPAMG